MAMQGMGNVFTRVDTSGEREALISYLDTVSTLEFNRTYRRQVLALLGVGEGDRILDVGCGTGEDVRTLAGWVGRNGLVVGVDSSEAMIAEANRRSAGLDLPVEFRQGDARRLNFPDNTFDGVRAERLLIHLNESRRGLTEMVRVARAGARIVVGEPDWETLVLDVPERAVTRTILHFGCDSYGNGWAGRQLVRHFKELGLIAIRTVPTTVLLTEYLLADQVLRLRSMAEYAQQAGVVSASDVALWLSHLEEASRAGQFFSAITGFTVCGMKPAPGEALTL